MAFNASHFPRIRRKWPKNINKLTSSMEIYPYFILIQKRESEKETLWLLFMDEVQVPQG